MRIRMIALWLCLMLTGCQSVVDVMVSGSDSHGDSGGETSETQPQEYACNVGEVGTATASTVSPAAISESDAPAKPRSDTFANAVRMYQQLRYDEALPLLLQVASGQTDDSTTRQEWATMRVAFSHYHLEQWREATQIAESIAVAPSHSEHARAGRLLLLLVEHVEVREKSIDLLAQFTPDELVPTDARSAMGGTRLLNRARLLVGRAQLRLGNLQAARSYFAAVNAGPFAPVARRCDAIAVQVATTPVTTLP